MGSEPLKECRLIENSRSGLRWYFCEKGGLVEVRKKRKTRKERDMWPLFGDYVIFVVVIRKACSAFEKLKSLVCDRDS